jgi:hypothetical protein
VRSILFGVILVVGLVVLARILIRDSKKRRSRRRRLEEIAERLEEIEAERGPETDPRR